MKKLWKIEKVFYNLNEPEVRDSDFKNAFLGIFYFTVGILTSMLVTDVEDDMCWWKLWDVGDSVGYSIINIQKLTSRCHQLHQSPRFPYFSIDDDLESIKIIE